MNKEYTVNGIQLHPTSIKSEEDAQIFYDGLLSKSGAQEVYVHCGSSYGDDWKDVQDIKMERMNQDTFTANVKVPKGNIFHLCFHDNANNWDNNSGENYSYTLDKI